MPLQREPFGGQWGRRWTVDAMSAIFEPNAVAVLGRGRRATTRCLRRGPFPVVISERRLRDDERTLVYVTAHYALPADWPLLERLTDALVVLADALPASSANAEDDRAYGARRRVPIPHRALAGVPAITPQEESGPQGTVYLGIGERAWSAMLTAQQFGLLTVCTQRRALP
jgi:hypothetical protein